MEPAGGPLVAVAPSPAYTTPAPATMPRNVRRETDHGELLELPNVLICRAPFSSFMSRHLSKKMIAEVWTSHLPNHAKLAEVAEDAQYSGKNCHSSQRT
jgi:hypothetical protein